MIGNNRVNLFIRDVNGVLLLDKPKGISSNCVLSKIKRFFCAKKAGYAGILDPIATGMLPIFFGKATSLAQNFLYSDKSYQVTAKLGESTDTFDATGIVIRTSCVDFSNNKIEMCLQSFLGELYQIPPMYSSIKYYGLPLYKYARQGMDIYRSARKIHVYNLVLIERKKNFIRLYISCSKGTYVRAIINDFGKFLGCGAHVTELRRLTVGRYTATSMIDFSILETIFYKNYYSGKEKLDELDRFLIHRVNL